MSVTTGLISGIDYDSMITQLMQVEANPQKLLQNKLTATKSDADAYRAVNTKFDALRTAAEALTKTTTWAAAKATSSSTAVSATSGAGASAGSLTFSVTSLAAPKVMVSAQRWGQTSDPLLLTSPLQLTDAAGVAHDIPLDSSPTLAEAVTAINASGLGVTAAAVNTGSGYLLQVSSTSTGTAATFSIGGATEFSTLSAATNATLRVGTATNGYDVVSPTNTFSEVLPGTTFTVGQQGGPVTVTVAGDPDAVATAVQALVTAANDVLKLIKSSTTAVGTTPATLQGDSTLRRLSGQVLEAVSTTIGVKESAATAGMQLNRYGEIVFDKTAFANDLKANPDQAQRLLNGTTGVPGVAQRLLDVATKATDSTTGTLTLVGKGQDTLVTDLTARIADWDVRLATRKESLQRQFTAMESMLGTLNSKSSWLSSQLKSLPTWSSSSS